MLLSVEVAVNESESVNVNASVTLKANDVVVETDASSNDAVECGNESVIDLMMMKKRRMRRRGMIQRRTNPSRRRLLRADVAVP